MNSADITTKYNSDCKKLLDYCNSRIANILKSKLSQKVKNNQILQIKNYFNKQSLILKNKFTADLAALAQALAQQEIAQALAQQAQNISLVITPKINKKALCIGINYIGSQYVLNGCINDVNNIKSKLISNYGFLETDILLLTDDTSSKIKPTKTNMLTEIKNLLVNAKSNDLLFLCFSGHGSQTTDLNGDEKDRLDEMIITSDLQSITDDVLNSLIRTSIPTSSTNVSLFVLFDSCHSGTMLDLKYQYLDTLNNNNNLTLNEKNADTSCNVVMISGCLDKQTSADAYINKQSQGAMTWSFLESLKTNPNITWKELIQSMRTLLSTSQYDQIPQLSSGKVLNLDAKVYTF